MNYFKAILWAGFVFSYANLYADYDLDDTGSVEFPDLEETAGKAFEIELSGDWIGKAKFKNSDASGTILYNHQEAHFNAVVWYNACCKEGFRVGLGYEYTRLDWNKNPYFKRKNYDTAVLSTVFFTERACDWRWVASLAFNFDADKWNFRDYTTYDMLLWGRYAYSECINLHAGIYAETGMKLDRVYPVIGFDWQISCRWKLSLVYPLNMSLVYQPNDCWSVALAGRVFSDRHRAGREGLLSEKSVWRYSNAGVELGINRTVCSWLQANVHVGYAWGGYLKIANRHSHDSHRFRFKDAPYAGYSLTIDF